VAWPFAVIAAALYGSLIPFKFDPAAYRAADGFGLFTLTWAPTSWEDILTNLAVYFPVGMTVFLAFRGTAFRGTAFRYTAFCCTPAWRWAAIIPTVLIGGAVSLLAETLQSGIAQRQASWIDVALNVAGTAIGGVCGAALASAGESWLSRVRTAFNRRPCSTVAAALTLGLIVYNLAPFDFVTSTAKLHQAFLRANWSLMAPRPPASDSRPLGPFSMQLAGAAWFAVLGYFTALARREDAIGARAAFVSAVGHGFLLAVMIELLQLFTSSHRFDLLAVPLRGLSVTIGAWGAVFVLDTHTRSAWRLRRRLVLPTLMLLAAVAFQTAVTLVRSIDPVHGLPRSIHVGHVAWLPFERLWRGSMLRAGYETAAGLASFAVLAIMVAILLRRTRIGNVWAATATVVGLFAVLTEVLQAVTLAHTPDSTMPLLALISVGLVARVDSALRPAVSFAAVRAV
jgi:glycopeptide antibiotics resistance protein